MSTKAAVRNIEHWEEAIEEADVSGLRPIQRDLAALRKALEDDEPDGERIRHLMARLAKATRSISDKAEPRYQDQLEDLGEMLADAAEEGGEQDDRTSMRARGRSGSDGRGEVRDPEHDGRLRQNRDRGERQSRSAMSSRQRDEDNDDDGRGEVRDLDHDGRLRQNRDRGVSMSDRSRNDNGRARQSR